MSRPKRPYMPYDILDCRFRSLYLAMPFCAVLGCANDSRDGNLDDSITFHRFPKDPDGRSKWVLATGRQYWKPKFKSTICSVHFKNKMFIDRKKGYLKKDALPTLKVFAYDYDAEESISNSDSDVNDEPTTSTDGVTNTEKTIKDVSQDDDDDDIICVESSPAKKPKIDHPTPTTSNSIPRSNAPRLGFVREVPAVRNSKKKTPQEIRNDTHKMEIINDEFQMFANNIAAQLRTLPLDVALNLQTEVHKLIVKERTKLYRMWMNQQSVDESSVENNLK